MVGVWLRLLIISDLHGSRSYALRMKEQALTERVDATIVCGDITDFGSLGDAENLLEELSSSGRVFFVHGNCDPSELAGKRNFSSAENLHERSLRLNETWFVGVGGSLRTPFRTRVEYSEGEMLLHLEKAYSRLEGEKLVLVSHNPPFGEVVDKIRWGEHIGSQALRAYILDVKPVLAACGHVHEGRGVERIGKTLVVNPGPAVHGYSAIAELTDDGVDAELRRLI